MSQAHYIRPTAPTSASVTARLGAGNTTSDNFTHLEHGKAVKLVAESRYNLCAAGDEIAGFITSVEPALQGGYSIGGVYCAPKGEMVWATADGLQATPGTGNIAVGDYVVAGTATAKGTALTQYAKVCKATALSFATTPAVDFPAGSHLNNKWQVVSLGPVGTGAVGTAIVLKRVS